MTKKTTINDVAKRAGVSSALVSMVINNYPNVSLRSVKAVTQAMDELDYRPSATGPRQGRSARSRKRRATNRVALFVFNSSETVFTTEIYLKVLHGIESALRKHGKHLQIHFFKDEQEFKKYFPTGKVDGVIFLNTRNMITDKCMKTLRHFPVIQIMGSHFQDDKWWDHVSYDDRIVGRLAADCLLGFRFDDYAVIQSGDSPRCACAYERLVAAGKRVTLLDLIISGDEWDIPINDLLRVSPFPRGIFCYGDEAVPELYKQMRKRGYYPEKDFQVVSCDNNSAIMQVLDPPPATIDIQSELIGKRAVDQLMWRMDNPDPGKIKIALEPKLIVH